MHLSCEIVPLYVYNRLSRLSEALLWNAHFENTEREMRKGPGAPQNVHTQNEMKL